MTKIRTRFAPSPTGYIHVGNIRSALFPFLLARQNGGEFILRIEDTDQARFVPDAEKLILETLTWLGISWDEGPTLDGGEKGNFGSYHQTNRREIYYKYAEKLIANGFAYADPTSPEQLAEFREKARTAKKPFLFRDFRPEISTTPQWTPDCGLPLRFRAKNLKNYTWRDEVFGELSSGAEALDDFILIKSDGLPTYNFAHIVDDFEMQITHVIRGQEYLSSMPKYLSLYDALGIEWPIFAHLPHILAPDSKRKLGKRDGAKSVDEYRAEGFLPEAMVNFLAQLGWNDGTENEIFALDDLIEKFSLDRVQKSGARFDEKRLLWLNGQWIRKIAPDDLLLRMENFWGENARKSDQNSRKNVLNLVQSRLKTLADLPALSEYFFARPTPNWKMITENKQLKKLSHQEILALLKNIREKLALASESDFSDAEKLQEILNELLEENSQKPAILFSLIRFALTWAPFSPELNETMKLLGKNETLARIEAAIAASENFAA